MKKRWLKKWLAETSEVKRVKVAWVMGAFVLGMEDRHFQRGILRSIGLPSVTVRAARRMEKEGATKQLGELERAVGARVLDFVADTETKGASV